MAYGLHQCAAHVPPIFNLINVQKKCCIFNLVFGQNFSSRDANFTNFRYQDPSFFKENPLSLDPTQTRAAHAHQIKIKFPPSARKSHVSSYKIEGLLFTLVKCVVIKQKKKKKRKKKKKKKNRNILDVQTSVINKQNTTKNKTKLNR